MLRRFRFAAQPSITVLVAVLVSSVPWGLPASTAFVLPLATGMLIFLHAVRPKVMLPPWVAFLAGVLTDILTGGPLGYWAFVFLVAHGLGRSFPREGAAPRLSGLWPTYALIAAALAALAWTVASAYFVRLIDWRPMLIAVAIVTVLFPLLARAAGYRKRLGLWAGE